MKDRMLRAYIRHTLGYPTFQPIVWYGRRPKLTGKLGRFYSIRFVESEALL